MERVYSDPIVYCTTIESAFSIVNVIAVPAISETS